MYKFTNGIVVFDEKTRDRYIEAGYRLVKEPVKEVADINVGEEQDENSSNNGTIEEKPRRNKKVSK